MTVSFVDLRAQHEEVRPAIDAAFQDILDRSAFIGGSHVKQFEADFAAFCGAGHAVAVSNGTDALRLALMGVGVKPGDEIITVPNTFIATVEAITQVGAYPVLVDILPETSNINPACVESFLINQCQPGAGGRLLNRTTGRPVTALLPVHLYGLPADLQPLRQLAKDYGLKLVEDACQAHGAAYLLDGEWHRTGTLGQAAAFSFYPGKNLGAIGEGGAVVTNDAVLADQVRLWRDHGQSERYIHVTPEGWNARLDSVQCAVLGIKLKKLDEWNNRRRAAAAHYREALADLPLKLPVEPAQTRHVYHLYVVETPRREQLRQGLNARGIATGLHYPIPLHRQQAYAHLGLAEGTLPNAERSAANLLSLPMHPALTPAHVDEVATACRDILSNLE